MKLKRRVGGENKTTSTEIFLSCISLLSFYFVYHIWSKDNPPSSNTNKRLTYSLHHDENNVSPATTSNLKFGLPLRIKKIIESNELNGIKKLEEIKHVGILLDEITYKMDQAIKKPLGKTNQKTPMSIEEIISYLNGFISELSAKIKSKDRWTAEEAWEAYRNLTFHTLYKWDQDYLSRMPVRRSDDSLYFSLVSYRDENCISTITNAFEKADRPEKLFVGLVQQNCVKDCKGAGPIPVDPDEDCYEAFCSSSLGKPLCESGHVRSLFIHESESLGPYTARLFASKLWYGETWFLQTDSHMTFLQGWDTICVDMLKNAPTKKAAISHYPPPHTADLESKREIPGARLCGPMFSTQNGEAQIIRLIGEAYFDTTKLPQPRFAPFVGAGFFLVHSGFLREVPFDPFLPWIFMGEEIILSARLWTHGYDIYSPTQPVLGHKYGRLDKPKFWDTINRVFKSSIFNELNSLIVQRVKYQIGYPESARDLIWTKSLFTALEDYTLGNKRSLEDYLEYCSLDLKKKQVLESSWCENGGIPKGFEQFAHFYK